jgi:hypothetical protein
MDFLCSLVDRNRFVDLMRLPVSETFADMPVKNKPLSDRKADSLIRKGACIQEARSKQQLHPYAMDKAILLLLSKCVPVRLCR